MSVARGMKGATSQAHRAVTRVVESGRILRSRPSEGGLRDGAREDVKYAVEFLLLLSALKDADLRGH